MRDNQSNPVYIGVRSVYEHGNSLVVSLPKSQVQSAGYDTEDLLGDHRTILTDEGEFKVELDK